MNFTIFFRFVCHMFRVYGSYLGFASNDFYAAAHKILLLNLGLTCSFSASSEDVVKIFDLISANH